MTIQKKFFAVLKERAESFGLELVLEFSFSNVGVLHLQTTDSFNTLLSLPFDFQTGRVSFGWMGDQGLPVFPERANPRYAGFTPAELDDAIDAILNYALEPTNA